MNDYKRILNSLHERRDNIIQGKINCIPLPFPRFKSKFPGIEKERIVLVSGSTKAAKSQLTNFLYIIGPLMYCYLHPNQIRVKIFVFPLEESKEAVTLKIYAYLLYYLSKGKIKLSPTQLKSTSEACPIEAMQMMESDEFKAIVKLYESMVIFFDDKNRVGIYKTFNNYANTHGKNHYKPYVHKSINEVTGEVMEVTREMFDYYEADDPEEYVIGIVDHVSLLEPIRGETLRETISNFADDLITLRNRYKYTIVAVQQQNIETTGLEAIKVNRIAPTIAGLADCKDVGKACNVMIGITNPNAFALENYMGYNISVLKGKARFMEIVINRDGESNDVCPLYFDGSVNYFKELPLPATLELENIYRKLRDGISFITYSLNNLYDNFTNRKKKSHNPKP